MNRTVKIVLISIGGFVALNILIGVLVAIFYTPSVEDQAAQKKKDDSTQVALADMQRQKEVDAAIARNAEREYMRSGMYRWKQWKKDYVSSWDGSCLPVEQHLEKTMNDPDSYEHVETKYVPNDDTTAVVLITKIRGKNAFGAKILTSYVAKVDMNGTVLEMEQAD